MLRNIKFFLIILFNIALFLFNLENETLKIIFEKVININYIYIVFTILSLINIFISKIKKYRSFLLGPLLLYLYLNLIAIKELKEIVIIFYLINIILIWKNILKILEEELLIDDFYLNTFLSVFGVYYLLKEKNIIRDYVNNNIEVKIILVIYTFLLIMKNKEKIKNDIRVFILEKKICSIISFTQQLLPFYLLKDGGIKIFPILMGASIFKVLKAKEIKYKKVCFSALLFGLIISLSYFFCINYGIDSKRNLNGSLEIIIILIVLLNLSWDKETVQKSIYVFIVSSLLTVNSVIVLFSENKFMFTRYADGYLIIPFGIKYSIISLVLLHIILKYYRYSLIPILSLSILGVILSGSRGPLGILFILFFLLIVSLYRRELKKILKIGVFFISILSIIILANKGIRERSILAIKGKDPSTLIRIEIYKESWRQFKNKPLIGNGIGSYDGVSKIENKNKITKTRYQRSALFYHTYSHNNILGILSGMGILGLISYFYSQYTLLKNLINKREALLGIIVYLAFQLNGVTDMTIIFYSIQKIVLYILVLVIFDKEIIKE